MNKTEAAAVDHNVVKINRGDDACDIVIPSCSFMNLDFDVEAGMKVSPETVGFEIVCVVEEALYTYSQTDIAIVYVLGSETAAHMMTQSFFFLVTAFAPPAPPDTPR